MADPEDMVLRLLRDIRATMDRNVEATNERFDRLESKIESIRRASFGESVLGRYAVAEVDERMDEFEKRLAALEGRK